MWSLFRRFLGVEMGVLKYKRMTDLDTKTTSVYATNNEISVSKVKNILADILQVAKCNIDIVQKCNIKLNDGIVTLDTVAEVIVHPENRTLPFRLRTSEPDCLTGMVDEETGIVRLTCSHYISPDMLYTSCLSQLNDRKASFTCPAESCLAQLEFEEVIQKACLSEDEILFFEQRIYKNTAEKAISVEMGRLTYKRMIDIDFRTTDVDESNNEIPVSKVRSAVADILQVSKYDTDIVQKCNIKRDDSIVTLDTEVEVIIHPENRTLPFYLRTSKPDCVTGMIDEDTGTVKLTCSHYISPDILYSSCLSQLNDRKTSFTCPAESCRAQLEFEEVIQKACLSEDEISFFEQRINKNTTEKGKSCPNCTSFCERINNDDPRVVCCYCKHQGKAEFEFCWNCLLSWKDGHNCPSPKMEPQKQLNDCQRITLEYNGMEDVPNVRACPNCTFMIKHEGGCKTMTCSSCQQVFCFCCLKLAINGALQCGNHNVVCTVAPIQTL